MDEFWKRVEPLIPVRQRKQACPGAARTGRRRATLALGLCFLPALGAPARSQQRGAGRDMCTKAGLATSRLTTPSPTALRWVWNSAAPASPRAMAAAPPPRQIDPGVTLNQRLNFVRTSRRALLRHYRHEPNVSRSPQIFLDPRDDCQIFAEAWVKHFTAPKASLTMGSNWSWPIVAQTIV